MMDELTIGKPYYEQIFDRLVDAMRRGELTEGDAVPSIRALAAELTVATVTVRRAYDDLERAGLIVRHRGRGTFVSATPDRLAALGRSDADALLGEAVAGARRLGMDDDAIRLLVEQHLLKRA
jgi:GntR family transcriptional regulator